MERSRKVNFDDIWGREFRVPTIVGEGSGEGFQFSNLHLPRGWEEIVPELQKISPAKFQKSLESRCQNFGLPLGKVEFYPENQLLKGISIKTRPVSRLELSTDFPDKEGGLYQGDNVRNLHVAIVLQRLAAGWLALLWDSIDPELSGSYSFIDGHSQGGGFWSENLIVPEEYLNAEKPVTNESFQWKLRLEASNIAGRFGLSLRDINFNQNGVPVSFGINEGNACRYNLNVGADNGQYSGHNVDRADQVATLHGIGAFFINHLYERKFRES